MIAVLAALLCLALIAWNYFYSRRWDRGVSVGISFSRPATYVGKTFELTEVIENRKKWPVPVMEIGFRVPIGIRFTDAENTQISDYIYKKDLFALLGMESITRKYEMEAAERGCYDVSQVVCEAPSLLHIYRYRMECSTTDRIYAYARRVDVSRIVTSVETILGELESNHKTYEDPFAFASIREYTIRDPMKTINWKASARSGNLMVNTFTSVRSEEIEVCLDVEDSGILKHSPLVEESISIAASLCEKLMMAARTVEFRINIRPSQQELAEYGHTLKSMDGYTLFPAASGQDRHQSLERFLTGKMADRDTVPFADMAFSGSVPPIKKSDSRPAPPSGKSGENADRVRILISKNIDSDWIREHRQQIDGSCILVIPHRHGSQRTPVSQGIHCIDWEMKN